MRPGVAPRARNFRVVTLARRVQIRTLRPNLNKVRVTVATVSYDPGPSLGVPRPSRTGRPGTGRKQKVKKI